MDGDDWRESETAQLLERRPLSDSAPQSGSEGGEEPCTVTDTVWYRHTPVLLALVASSLNGLYFSFIDEVCDLTSPSSSCWDTSS